MSYCINHLCKIRTNSIDANECNNCGQKSLLICSGKYRLIEMIGNTSQQRHWEVFTGGDTRTGITRSVVIKTLRNNTDKNQRLFNTEEEILRKAKGYHGIPKLVKDVTTLNLDLKEVNTTTLELRDIDIEERKSGTHTLKIPYFVMEYIDGLNLKEWLGKNKKIQDCKDAWRWLREMICILDYVHNLGYIHRDLKPENIILKKGENTLVLIDFGIAKHIYSKVQGTNTVVGTPGYRSQEQTIPEGDIGYHSDFYALGRTFFYLATGEPPSDNEKLEKNWNEKTNFSNSPIINLIEWMAKEEINERPQTASKILCAIDILSKPKSDGTSYTKEDANNLIKNINRDTQRLTKRPKLESNLIKNPLIIFGIFTILVLSFSLIRSNISLEQTKKDLDDLARKLNEKEIVKELPCKQEQMSSGETYMCLYGSKSLDTASDEIIKNATENLKNGDNEKNNLEKKTSFYLKAFQEFQKFYLKYGAVNPEIPIYLNNSKVKYLHSLPENRSRRIYTIAVVAPGRLETGQHILLGVALSQQYLVNHSSTPKTNELKDPDKNSVYLVIKIAEDGNDPKNTTIAKNLANDLANDAVVGPYSTEVIEATLGIYANAKSPLAVVSPTASKYELTKKYEGKDKKYSKNVFFRIISSTEIEAKAWVDLIKKESLLKDKPNSIVAFYKKKKTTDTNEGFSENLFNIFQNLTNKEHKDLHVNKDNEFDLSNPNKQELRDFINKKINKDTVILLIPNGLNPNDKNDPTFANALAILDIVKKDKIKAVFASNPLFSVSDVMVNDGEGRKKSQLQDWIGKLYIAVDWHYGCNSKATANQDFWNFIGGPLDRRTSASYEAVQVLSSLFTEKATRNSIITGLKQLKSSTVESKMTLETGDLSKKISFEPNGDRNKNEIKDRIIVSPVATTAKVAGEDKKKTETTITFKEIEGSNCPSQQEQVVKGVK
jgi:eukaryotic-like serine/threonine-protein kinase